MTPNFFAFKKICLEATLKKSQAALYKKSWEILPGTFQISSQGAD